MIEWYHVAKERKAMIEMELVNEIEMRENHAQDDDISYSR